MRTLEAAIRATAADCPTAAAIRCRGRPPLGYADLAGQIDRVRAHLAGCGIGRGQRVVVVGGEGPELLAAFAAVSASATYVPLPAEMPVEQVIEIARRVDAAALIVDARLPAGLTARAADDGLRVLRLVPTEGGGAAGRFELQGAPVPATPGAGATLDDDAILYATSGTTGRPKLVRQTHRTLATAATRYVVLFGLGRHDACQVVMPMHHSHALTSNAVVCWQSGGAVVCSDQPFSVAGFFADLAAFRPTWYSAGPTHHRAVAAAAPRHGVAPGTTSLRFIRNGSDRLTDETRAALEAAFGVPVFTSYGLTEANHLAIDSWPATPRVPGSVGRVGHGDVAVLGDDGELLAPGEIGEIAVSGPTVTPGYFDDPALNAGAFDRGWFRTGDVGWLDAEGWLFLTGRKKELIYRGGDKVSPVDIERVLLGCPGVADVAVFPMAHPSLGQEIGVAVVPAAGAILRVPDLERFAEQHLERRRRPRRWVVAERIPRSALGKLMRMRLAEDLGIADSFAAPAAAAPVDFDDPVAATVVAVWAVALGRRPSHPQATFVDLGGDSLTAAAAARDLSAVFAVEVPFVELLDPRADPAHVARWIRAAQAAAQPAPPSS